MNRKCCWRKGLEVGQTGEGVGLVVMPSNCDTIQGKMKWVLTLQPFGVIFECPAEWELALARRQVVQITPEDNGVCFREFSIRARVL